MIVLIGFMGAGKTTVGRALADRLGLPFVDTDQIIEQAAGLTIAEIFEGYGEPGFRELEARVVTDRLAGPDAVLALGGGAITTETVRRALTGHQVVLLDISLADTLRRIGGDPGRPMLHRPDLAEIFAARAGLYREIASVRLPVAGRSEVDLVESITTWLDDPAALPLDPEPPEAPE
ncbi:MAG: shikimate kinase [Propionicimonas sp.]|uniref:shikimate kinase n=1 Tax=Propionicimonas sp. TaxID=1955623 RepID=UPI002B1FF72A|nr:shikimate kinase [Propionicimonas sp.]MEA4943298.1 shikimate kinase [Propionicimonas sp.]